MHAICYHGINVGFISQLLPKDDASNNWEKKEEQYHYLINQLRAVVNHLSNPIFSIELDGSINYMSRGAATIFNSQPAAFVGRKFQVILPLEPHEGLREFFSDFLDQKLKIAYEFTHGETPLQLTINPIYNPATKAINGGVIEITDLTEKKRFEQRQVDFVAFISHELRTPISSVKGYLNVVMEEGDYLTPEHKEFIRRAYVSNERQERTVEDLIELSDLERGELNKRMEVVDPIPLTNEVVTKWQKAASDKGLQLIFQYPKFSVPHIDADTTLYCNILDNVIENAIKYTPKGEVRVQIEKKDANVEVSVTDTGPGISKEAQSEIFNKFVRGEHSMTETTQGSGLGLFLAKSFAEEMGGTLTVKSQVNNGATFILSLKASEKLIDASVLENS
ncbi:HAMP domain-containing histidine kinase [candidate division WWE3 bacterium]|uniref:histidine kinase n=1 Tax=candidate division WWE3 bacterium TaxID=2053526 RepID=A0A955RS59_UNCKA|nr:HAMP domain-containing histidine kinase [candidate division WWE3 bacterium]